MLAKRVRGLEYAIRDVVIPAKKLEARGYKVIRLNIGDPNQYDFDTPTHAKEAACQAIRGGRNGYSSSHGDKEVVAAVMEREKKFNASKPSDCLLTLGVSEGVHLAFEALLNPGDNALVPGPFYPVYDSVAKLCGAKAVEYECSEGKDWEPVVSDLRKKIDGRTKAIIVINPNNPTGAVYNKKTLKAIIDLAGEHNIPLISDEIYDQLFFGEYVSLTSLVKDSPLINLNGMSKTYCAPGWRIGYMAFRNCDEIASACFAQTRARLSVNTPSSIGYKAALEGPQDHVERMKKTLVKRRDYVMKRLGEIGLKCVEPKAAFYVFPQTPVENDKKWVLDLLEKEKVLVVHGSGFGDYGKKHFRLVYLAPIPVLEEALDKIERFTHQY